MDLIPGACSQSTGQLPVSFNSVGVAVVTVAAISYMAAVDLGVLRFMVLGEINRTWFWASRGNSLSIPERHAVLF